MPWIMLDRTGNETVTTPNRGTTAKRSYDPQYRAIERSLYHFIDPNVQHSQRSAIQKHGVRFSVNDCHFGYYRHFDVRDMIE
jgi:hypothetical protein